jgi:hypothetical protein
VAAAEMVCIAHTKQPRAPNTPRQGKKTGGIGLFDNYFCSALSIWEAILLPSNQPTEAAQGWVW